IEPATGVAIREQAPNLARISRERIGQEVALMLAAPTRAKATALIQNLTLDAPTLDEAHITAALPTLEGLPPDAGLAAALAAWMLDRHLTLPATGAPASVDGAGLLNAFVAERASSLLARWRAALCLSNEDRDRVQQILNLLARALAWSGLGVAARK